MARGNIGYLPTSAEDAESYMGMSFYDYLRRMGYDPSLMNPGDLEAQRNRFYTAPDLLKRDLQARESTNYAPPPEMDYRGAMEASRSAAIQGLNIPGSYSSRESMYSNLANRLLNPNTQEYTDRQQDILGMLYSQATDPSRGQAQNLSRMLQQNAGQVADQTRQSALSTGLNKVATARLANQAKSDYLRTAEDQAKLLGAQEKSMAEQLALGAIGSQYGTQIQGAMTAAQRAAADQKAKESIYLDQMQNLMGVSDEQRKMDQILAQQRARETQQYVGAAANTAGQIGAAFLANS